MNPILERIRGHLIAHDLSPSVQGQGDILVVQVTLKNVAVTYLFSQDADNGVLAILVRLPVLIPEDRRPAVSEFLTRLNWGLQQGRYVMDHSDGECGFRLDAEPAVSLLTEDRITRWLLLPGVVVDGFFPALMQVVYRNMNPVQAVEQGEAEYAALLEERAGQKDSR